MAQDFIHKFAMLDPRGHYLIYRPWMHIEEFKEADEWLRPFAWTEAHWDFGSGVSNINNVQYPTRVFFDSDNDYLVFKLKFPNLLKW